MQLTSLLDGQVVHILAACGAASTSSRLLKVATLEDLEARIAALEAAHADYRAVLAAINALGSNQRELALGQRQLSADVAEVRRDVASVKNTLSDTNAHVRSLEEGQAEIKDLLVRALDRDND